MMRNALGLLLALIGLSVPATSAIAASPVPGTPEPRSGDEIVVCGQFFHTGTRVVLWIDPGGYDAYRLEPRYPFPPPADPKKLRGPGYGDRTAPLTEQEAELTRGGNWALPELQQKVDQFVIHYDVAGVSRECFRILFARGLSVQFMCDIDGTIYQTLDLKDGAWHATIANGRSVGVEVANMGGYKSPVLLEQWYKRDPKGQVSVTIPERLGDGGVLTPRFVGHPIRNQLIHGTIQGRSYSQYDFTAQQYEALSHLTASLCTIFPKIQCDYPRQKSSLGPPTEIAATQPAAGDPTTRPTALVTSPEEHGTLIPHKLQPEQWDDYQGVLGHYHVQYDKEDPGPAFQWDLMINRARSLMTPEALRNNARHRHQPARTIPSTQPAAEATAKPAAQETPHKR
ncbi:MAG TPA: N-acetylmuramoyl-L-alanine amidase [Tepidisphaeraceae bacterium]